LLVTLPKALVTTTEKRLPLSASVVGGVVYFEFVAPAIVTPFLLHWQLNGGAPLATTWNLAVRPTFTRALAGCCVIWGNPSGVEVGVAVGEGLGEAVGVGVSVAVGLGEGVGVGVSVAVGLGEGVAVGVGVGVGVEVGSATLKTFVVARICGSITPEAEHADRSDVEVTMV